jgi:hypothetical protein
VIADVDLARAEEQAAHGRTYCLVPARMKDNLGYDQNVENPPRPKPPILEIGHSC